ncbi:hypothetical protein PPL_11271 [Heterostelium album PN500]|uniref:Clu domain-containing protein n=1 Tax=Heterostelium pallidum (strain ATCC 26659 / Pp 5 / PN500) TaxID=670386 RepID=D3BU11_HETP5|nr:hypothetical protein PPL_11271 [Heterostelium album PN500]EFA75197.1 hypothetical protein PPL_11271 [Heterostelium album PN500]|eukprot:XP_020427331.1 hypothetical protein PPL_11271 [Heterostelium album PN500]
MSQQQQQQQPPKDKKDDKSFREILSYWAVKEPVNKQATLPTPSKLKPSRSNSNIHQLSVSSDSVGSQQSLKASQDQIVHNNQEQQLQQIQQPQQIEEKQQSQPPQQNIDENTVTENTSSNISQEKLVDEILKQVESLENKEDADVQENINKESEAPQPPTIILSGSTTPEPPLLNNSYTFINDSPLVNDVLSRSTSSTTKLTASMNGINLRTSNNWANISRQPTNPYMTINEIQNQQQQQQQLLSDSSHQTFSDSYVIVGDDSSAESTHGSSQSSYSLYTVASSASSYTSYSSGAVSGGYLYADSNHSQSSYLAYSTATEKTPNHFNLPHEHNIPKVEVFRPLTECQKISAQHSWNDNFQHLLELEDSEIKYEYLSKNSNDFVYCANTFGKIIISEVNLPDEQKTIKPLSLGGVAGGYKYKCQDIIFKFVVDVEIAPGLWMYGDTSRSDEKAQKSAGHELKGLNYFMEHSNGLIKFPLMAIIDYGGYRLLAISNLPITKKSIVYGSNDGGKTIHNSDPVIEKEMERLAGIMNIKGHMVGLVTPTLIYGPGDIEVHKGTDGNYYMIDFARAFPPEYPQSIRDRIGREIFYAMLRPEFVARYEVPLSPDAFSGWQNGKDEDQSNLEVMEATVKLHQKVIPECVELLHRALQDECSSEIDMMLRSHLMGQATDGSNQTDYTKKIFMLVRVINFIHSYGINLRYLGLICQKTTHRGLRKTLMTEIVARVWKKIIKDRLREKMETSNRPSDEPARVLSEVFEILQNKVMKSNYKDFWSLNTTGTFKYAAIRAFPHCFSESEFAPTYDLRHSLDNKLLVIRIIQMMNVRLNPEAYRQFLANPKYVISNHDIEDVEPIVKYPTVVDFAAGSHLIYQAESKMQSSHSSVLEVFRWMEMAQKKMQSALRSMPLSAKVTLRQASIFILKSNLTNSINESIAQLQIATNLLRQASKCPINQNNPDILALIGVTLLKIASHYLFHNNDFVKFKKYLDEAQPKLERSLEINSDSLGNYIRQFIPFNQITTTHGMDYDEISSTITSTNSSLLYQLITIIYLLKFSPQDSRLKTYLPLSIGDIKSLSQLEIPIGLRKVIDDSIIAELLENLPNLFHLEVSSMSLTPKLSHIIANLKYLKSIALFDSNISSHNAIENDITNLNQFLSAILRGAPMLTSLTIANRSFEDADFADIGPLMENLTSLTLSRGYITNKTLIAMAPYLTNLNSLELRVSGQITNEGTVPLIQACKNLTKLAISIRQISDDTGNAIAANAEKLEYLSLSGSSGISAGVLAEIVKNAPAIRVLDISATNANYTVFEALESHGAKNLTKLYLEQTNVSTDEFNPLQSLTMIEPSNLRVLHLSRYIGEYCIFWKLMDKLPKLERLRLPQHTHLPTLMNAYKDHVENNFELQEIPLSEITHIDMLMATISVGSLTQLLEMCPLLESLSLSAVTFVTEESIVIQMNDSILAAIGPMMSNLKELNLSNLPIEKRMIPCLVSRCIQLRKVYLYGCKPLNAQAIYDIGREFPHIKFLG